MMKEDQLTTIARAIFECNNSNTKWDSPFASPILKSRCITYARAALEAMTKHKVSWKANQSRLQSFVAQGLSSGQIAREFNCSKNAVASACSRAGLRLRGSEKFTPKKVKLKRQEARSNAG